jgi:glucose/arabinose dehydrogenase
MRPFSSVIAATLAFAAPFALFAGSDARADGLTKDPRLNLTVVAQGFDSPWSVAFLPGGGYLVTERDGQLRRVDAEGNISAPLAGVPPVAASGQGGLLDVVLDRAFATNRVLYLSYSEPGAGGAGTAVARATLGAEGLTDIKVIFRQVPKVQGGRHFGSRIVQAADGHLFITTGDRGHQGFVQDMASTIGKVIRIRPDGAVPADNPFVATAGARPEIWSLGHRNAQGATLHPTTGKLWLHEHGARGGDEVNVPEAGKNYGWPVITLGVDYSGAKIGEGKAKAGMEQPIHSWTPSIAPSGMAFSTHAAFKDWRGDLFVGALAGARLMRVDIEGDRVVGEEALLTDLGERIRDVREGPDGALYLLTDSSAGQLLRLTRK